MNRDGQDEQDKHRSEKRDLRFRISNLLQSFAFILSILFIPV